MRNIKNIIEKKLIGAEYCKHLMVFCKPSTNTINAAKVAQNVYDFRIVGRVSSPASAIKVCGSKPLS